MGSIRELRFGICRCVAERYPVLPAVLPVVFYVRGRRVVQEFSLRWIVIPEDREVETLVKSRAHFFFDAHKRASWHLFVELLEQSYFAASHEEVWCTHWQRFCSRAAFFRIWESDTLPDVAVVLRAAGVCLQRYKRYRGGYKSSMYGCVA